MLGKHPNLDPKPNPKPRIVLLFLGAFSLPAQDTTRKMFVLLPYFTVEKAMANYRIQETASVLWQLCCKCCYLHVHGEITGG